MKNEVMLQETERQSSNTERDIEESGEEESNEYRDRKKQVFSVLIPLRVKSNG